MRCVVFLALLGLIAFAAPAPIDPKFTAIFDVPKVHAPAISPDGRHVAFALREGENVFVGVLDINAATVGARVLIGADDRRDNITFISLRRPQVRNIVWISPRRFIVAADYYDIFAVDLDGTKLAPLGNAKEIQWYHSINNPSAPTTSWAPYSGSSLASRTPVELAAVTQDGTVAVIEAYNSPALSATGDKDVSLYRVEVQTGRSTRVGDLSIHGRLFYDHEGELRAYLATRQVPFRTYQRTTDVAVGKWRPIEDQADASQSEFTSTAENLVGHRSLPLGFAFDSSTLYIASNIGRDTFGIYGLDLQTGRRTPQAIEHNDFDLIAPMAFYYDSTLVLDRHRQKLAGVRFQALKAGALWVDRELGEIQARIDAKAPKRSMEILGWDESRERFLVHGYHRADAGAYLIYTKSEDRLQEYLPLMPSADATQLVTTNWRVKLPGARSLSGNLTRPSGGERVPTVIAFPQRPWLRAGPDFSPDVAAFARMGYAVLEVNTRGLPGLGLEHWLAARDEPDRVVAEEVFAALDLIARDAGIESERVTLFGSNFGGWYALRTLQLVPDRVRNAVVIDPTSDVSRWIEGIAGSRDPSRIQQYASLRAYFGSDAKRLKRLSPLQHPFPAKVPVFAAQNQTTSMFGMDFEKLRTAIRKANPASRWIDPPALKDPAIDRPSTFTKIEAFLREHRER